MISTVSVSSQGDFCLVVVLGVIILLKGQCHAIWQLYKILEGVFASTEFQN